jgi:hypothetical protein
MHAEPPARPSRRAPTLVRLDLAPTIPDIQASGARSVRAIAAELNARKVRTASGRGEWQAVQVQRVLARS